MKAKKRARRAICAVITFVMVLCPLCADAYELKRIGDVYYYGTAAMWADFGSTFKIFDIVDGTTEIETEAFSGRYIPTWDEIYYYPTYAVKIPESVEIIYGYAFGTPVLEIYYPGTREQWENISVGKYNGYLDFARIIYGHKTDYDVSYHKAEFETEKTVPIDWLPISLTINGTKLETFCYNGVMYFPLTWDGCRCAGLGAEWNGEIGGIDLFACNTKFGYKFNEIYNKNNSAQTAKFPVLFEGSSVSCEAYPALVYGETVYIPLTWENAVEKFGWQLDYSQDNNELSVKTTLFNKMTGVWDVNDGEGSLEIGNSCAYLTYNSKPDSKIEMDPFNENKLLEGSGRFYDDYNVYTFEITDMAERKISLKKEELFPQGYWEELLEIGDQAYERTQERRKKEE